MAQLQLDDGHALCETCGVTARITAWVEPALMAQFTSVVFIDITCELCGAFELHAFDMPGDIDGALQTYPKDSRFFRLAYAQATVAIAEMVQQIVGR